jgi:hypothetical protein
MVWLCQRRYPRLASGLCEWHASQTKDKKILDINSLTKDALATV